MTYYKFLNANSKLIIIKHYSPLYLEKHLWHHYTIMYELCIDLHWFQTHQNITSYKWLMQCLNTFIKVIMITFFGKSLSPQSINQSINQIVSSINQTKYIHVSPNTHTFSLLKEIQVDFSWMQKNTNNETITTRFLDI